jgi:MoaA/NifB/PqqE/SkfB family radical SAM enzyme
LEEEVFETMNLTGQHLHVLQVHPSRMCNLQCAYCYSASGPAERFRLESRLLVRAIEDAAALGYNMLSISGGEPLLYPELDLLLSAGRAAGMFVTIVSNGTLLQDESLSPIRRSLDLVAISIDGRPRDHNQIRQSPRAFEAMAENLPRLRAAEVPFGLIYTLTANNVGDLPWAAEFAVAQGATLLQVHPMERSGRGRDHALPVPGPEQLAQAWILIEHLRQHYAQRLPIHLDVFDSSQAGELAQTWNASRHELVSPLVLEADGSVSPWRYGFPAPFRIGSVRENSLANLYRFWTVQRGRQFHQMAVSALKGLTGTTDLPFVNLVEHLHDAAAQCDLIALNAGVNPTARKKAATSC